MVRNFTIHNDRLTSTKYPKGVTGNVNTYVCQFDIACDIDNLVWFCTFEQDELVIVRKIVNDKCVIPHEVLIVPKPVYIGCYATNGKDDIKRVSTNQIFFDVKQGAYREGTQPKVPTPDVWETLINKNIPIIGNNGNWFIWDIEKNEYVDSGKPSQGGGGGNVDLSDYYTKEKVDEKDNDVRLDIQQILNDNYIDKASAKDTLASKEDAEKLQQDISDLQADIVGREEKSNQVQDISNNLSPEKYPSTVAVFDYGQTLMNTCNSFTTGYVAQELGNIETSLENIIEKYGLGGDAS